MLRGSSCHRTAPKSNLCGGHTAQCGTRDRPAHACPCSAGERSLEQPRGSRPCPHTGPLPCGPPVPASARGGQQRPAALMAAAAAPLSPHRMGAAIFPARPPNAFRVGEGGADNPGWPHQRGGRVENRMSGSSAAGTPRAGPATGAGVWRRSGISATAALSPGGAVPRGGERFLYRKLKFPRSVYRSGVERVKTLFTSLPVQNKRAKITITESFGLEETSGDHPNLTSPANAGITQSR